jgi:7,8-dihydro-6-hydroxymethylpterin-pyrophosphokinase
MHDFEPGHWTSVRQPGLQVPLPGLLRRSFVLVPLVELDPLVVHPVTGETMRAHLSRLKNDRPPVKKGTRLWN